MTAGRPAAERLPGGTRAPNLLQSSSPSSLQLGVEPIGGRLTGAFNGTHAFAGWLDFVATLEAERRRALNANGVRSRAEPPA